jgi:hypothetical protein
LVGAQTCSLTKLLTDFGSPGKIFALTEDSLTKALTEQSELHNEMSLAAPGGSLQLVIDGDAAALAHRILIKHHHRRGMKSRDLARAPLSGSNSFLSSTVDTLFMDLETALAGMGER